MRPDEAEDFASWTMLKLIENDYDVVARHDRRCSFAGFISVVIQRLLLDYRVALWGKWHASAQAKRMGEPAITIEAMLYRDGRSLDEVFPMLLRRWPELTRESIAALANQLPARLPRPRIVDLALAEDIAVGGSVDETAFASERVALTRRIAELVRSALNELDEEDRLLLRLRFEGGMSVADIARVLGIEQKPIYRRIQRALIVLRRKLQAVGIESEDVEDVLVFRATELDFGFRSADRSSSDEELS